MLCWQLTDVDALLKSIESFKSLRYLMMMHNPGVPDMFAAEKDLSDYAKHRLYVIFKISSLACLDYQDVTEEERAEASVRGGFAKTASPAEAEDDGGAAAAVAEAVGDVADDSLGARKSELPSPLAGSSLSWCLSWSQISTDWWWCRGRLARLLGVLAVQASGAR